MITINRFWVFIIFLFFLPFFFVLPAQAAFPSAGDLIKASGPAVYYYAADGRRYVFPSEAVYKSWYVDFSTVKIIADSELAAIPLGGNITIRPGTKLIKIITDPKVYAVEPGGILRWIETEKIAAALYGENWPKRIVDMPDTFFINYRLGEPLERIIHPVGSLIRYKDSPDVYLITRIAGELYKRKIAGAAARVINRFYDENILTVDNSITYGDADPISGAEINLKEPAWPEIQVSEKTKSAKFLTKTEPIEPASLTVSLADNIVSTKNVIRNTKNIPLAAFTFSTGKGGDVTIKKLKITSYIDAGEGNGDFAPGSDQDGKAVTYAFDLISNIKAVDKETGKVLGENLRVRTDGILDFPFFNWVIPAGSSKTLIIKADISADAPYNNPDRLSLDIVDTSADISAEDGSDNSVVVQNNAPNGGNSPAVFMTVKKEGRLAISISSSHPNSEIVIPGTDIRVNSFEFTSRNEPFIIKNMVFLNQDGRESGSFIYDPILRYKNAQGATVKLFGSLGANTLEFHNMDLYVPADGTASFDISVSIKQLQQYGDSGRAVRIVFLKTSNFEAEALYSGRKLTEKDFGTDFLEDNTGSAPRLTIRNSYLVFSLGQPPTSGVKNRKNYSEVLRFSISNPTKNAATIKKMAFKIAPTDVGYSQSAGEDLLEYLAKIDGDAANDDDIVDLCEIDGCYPLAEGAEGAVRFSIYDSGSGVLDTTPADMETSSGDYGLIQYTFFTPFIIYPGQTKTLVLKLDTSGIAPGSRALTVSVLGDEDAPLIKNSNFLWNDGFKDISGYLISGLPLEGSRLKYE